MIQCEHCLELFDYISILDLEIVQGICKSCFRKKSNFIPMNVNEKKHENIIFENQYAIDHVHVRSYINLYYRFNDDIKSYFLIYYLNFLNSLFIFVQIYNILYLDVNNAIMMFHLILLLYSLIIFSNIKRKRLFEEYYMHVIYQYLKNINNY